MYIWYDRFKDSSLGVGDEAIDIDLVILKRFTATSLSLCMYQEQEAQGIFICSCCSFFHYIQMRRKVLIVPAAPFFTMILIFTNKVFEWLV